MSCGGGFKRRSESGRSSADDSPRLRIISSMKFRHLEYFIAAAEELNFTHAADRLSLLKEEPFISLNRNVSELRRLALESLPACSALAFVAAGFGVAVVSEPLRRIPAKLVCGVNSDALVNRYARKSPATSSQWWVVVGLWYVSVLYPVRAPKPGITSKSSSSTECWHLRGE